jgi:sulfur relay (sulfurtransferase) complex TusBCD TusD component (DsrE family)
MRVAYIISSSGHSIGYRLQHMVLSALENNSFHLELAGFFFIEDGVFAVHSKSPIGLRLINALKELSPPMIVNSKCALERGLALYMNGVAEPCNMVENITLGELGDFHKAISQGESPAIVTL